MSGDKAVGIDIPVLPRDEQLALYRLKIERELQDSVLRYLQVRLAIFTGVISLLVTGGLFATINGNITSTVRDTTEKQINSMESTRSRAVADLESINYQSRMIDRQVADIQRDLKRTKLEADDVAAQVKETYPRVEEMLVKTKQIDEEVRRDREKDKDVSFRFSQFFQEQQFRAKAETNEMRANIELLERGFAIIEELAGAIRQRDPRSELARQFAGFSERWQEVRGAYETRVADLRRRRSVKIIHYAREDASPEQKGINLHLIGTLQEAGFTVEEWQVPGSDSDFQAAERVAREFGLTDVRRLLDFAVVLHPKGLTHYEDMKAILAANKLTIPGPTSAVFAPTKDDILGGGGSFKLENVVLIAELSR